MPFYRKKHELKIVFKIILSAHIAKHVKGIPKKVFEKIFAENKKLSFDPRPNGVKKLKGYENLYRIRIENYIVVDPVEDKILIVEIIKIAHRQDVYN